jgi:hypothetical protein
LQFPLQAASPETSGYTLVWFFSILHLLFLSYLPPGGGDLEELIQNVLINTDDDDNNTSIL